ncbi:hypothetical protein DAH33_25735 [Escherichia coli]|nr:hypothetical protein DAH33_25735 [Escherichia coli]
MTSLKTSIKTITYLSDIGCLEIQGASLDCACLTLKSVIMKSNARNSIPFAKRTLFKDISSS